MKTLTLSLEQQERFDNIRSPEDARAFWCDMERHFAVNLGGTRRVIPSVEQTSHGVFEVTLQKRQCRYRPAVYEVEA